MASAPCDVCGYRGALSQALQVGTVLPLEGWKRATEEVSSRASRLLPSTSWNQESVYSQRCSSSRQALQNLAKIGLQTDKGTCF